MIFISHAADDKPVVDKFFNLLQTGAGVTLEDAFVSSVSGVDIPAGEDFVAEVKRNLTSSDLLILFITSNYYESRFCIAELGAGWIENKKMFPLVAPGMDREIGSNMLGTQTERINSTGLNKLFDQLKEVLSGRKFDTDRWELMRDEFMSEFEQLYPNLPRPKKVDRGDLENAERRAETAMELRREAESRVENLEQQIRELERAKDAEEVQEIRKKYSDEDERYEAHLEDTRSKLEDLSASVIRSIYARHTANDWTPSEQAWNWWGEELEREMDSSRISSDERENPKYLSANPEHPEVGRAIHALQDLDHFLSSEISPEFSGYLTTKHDIPIDLDNREYWEKVLLEGTELPQ
ncbi:MAG: TIR domain-containing protein [Bacteroidetes bacterium]|jgi:hypothetical protein|nr:TIR domain-containing protein [Bacteroidota bacterium]